MKRTITHFFMLFLICLVSSSAFAQDDPYARFVNNGLKLSRMQQYSAAIKEFDLATSISDTSAQIFYYKGLCYFSMRNAKEAIKPFEEAIERNPKHLDALSKLLICYKKEEDLENTINTYDRLAVAVSDKEKKLSAKKSVVYILLSEDSFDSAHIYIDQGLKIAPKDVELLMLKGRMLNLEEKYKVAEDTLKSAIAKFQGRDIKLQTQLNYELGIALHNQQKYRESSAAFRNANYGPYKAKVATFSPPYYRMVAYAHYSIYDYERSLNLVNIALQMDSTFEEAIQLRDQIKKTAIDRTEDVEAYKKVLNSKDLDEIRRYDIYKTSIEALIASKKYREAIEMSDSAIARFPEKSETYFMKSIALYENNFKEDAIALMDKLLKEVGHTKEEVEKYQFSLAMMFASKKEIKEAEVLYDKIIEKNGNYARPALFEKQRITAD